MISTISVFVFFCWVGLSVSLESSDCPEVKIPDGKIRGQLVSFRGSEVFQFLGIPFAEPPVGQLRLRKPVPVKPWNDTISHSNWTPQCIQPIRPKNYLFSENCLNLNVFTPKLAMEIDAKLRPVMVWIHGGGFTYGSANSDAFNGTVLSALENVVFVSMNYRLGPLGFLHLPEHGVSGNFGLWDQQLALKWVKANIKYFGGDPDQVTVFGESSGSMSVSAHILSPTSRGLFKNAIMQSGSMYNIGLLNDSKVVTKLLEDTNCTFASDTFSCLQSADVESFTTMLNYSFWPAFETEFLPESATELVKSIEKGINIFLGTNGNEGAAFFGSIYSPFDPPNITITEAKEIIGRILGDSLIDYFTERYLSEVDPFDSDGLKLAIASAYGDVFLACPTYMFGADAVKYADANVFAYFLSQRVAGYPFPDVGIPTVVTHGDDLPYMFGLPLSQENHDLDDFLLSLEMVNIWGNFAETGKATKVASREWLKWETDESGNLHMFVMELNSQELGQPNNKVAIKCQKEWPFPIRPTESE